MQGAGKMKDDRKTKKQLIEELAELRKQLTRSKTPKKPPGPAGDLERNFQALADNANDGKHSSRDAYEVVTATIAVVKSAAVISDPINGGTNPKAIPGATIRYTITVTNSGSDTADTVVTVDAIPTNCTYVAGTITLDTVAKTDASDADDDGALQRQIPFRRRRRPRFRSPQSIGLPQPSPTTPLSPLSAFFFASLPQRSPLMHTTPPSAVAMNKSPYAAAIPSHTGGEPNLDSASLVPVSASTAHIRPPFSPRQAALWAAKNL